MTPMQEAHAQAVKAVGQAIVACGKAIEKAMVANPWGHLSPGAARDAQRSLDALVATLAALDRFAEEQR